MACRPSTERVCVCRGVSLPRGDVEDKEGAKANSGGRDEWSVGVEAEGAAGEQDPARGEGGVLGGVGDLVDGLAAQRRRGG